MSLELVMLVPVLVLLTLFVLWAGRGGSVALTADLAAEEAATAAALCCEEDDKGGEDRETLVEDMLASRPGLEYLCVDGPRPVARPDDGGSGPELVEEQWVDFEPGRATGGLGVLGVRFECETDGAVAPLQGLFPSVTFHGQATEVVLRQPLPSDIGFEGDAAKVYEGEIMVFELFTGTPVPYDVRVDYTVRDISRGATAGEDYVEPSFSVIIPQGHDRAQIEVRTIDDILYEGTEWLVLELTELYDTQNPPNTPHHTEAKLADRESGRLVAAGEIEDNDPEPHLFVSPVDGRCQVKEGHTATFEVRLRDQHNTMSAPSASIVRVDVRTEDGTATVAAPADYAALGPTALIFAPAEVNKTVVVQTSDDEDKPEGESDETFKLVLENPSGAPLGRSPAEAECTIIDDEVDITITPVEADEDKGELRFQVMLNDGPEGDIQLRFELQDYPPKVEELDPELELELAKQRATRGSSCSDEGVDYEELDAADATVTIPSSHDPTKDKVFLPVAICADRVVERDETFWLKVELGAFGEAIIEPDGGAVGTILNDDFPAITVNDPTCVNGVDAAGDACVEWTVQEPFEPLADDPSQVAADRVMTFTVNLFLGSCSDTAHKTEAECTGGRQTWTSGPAEVAETVTVNYAIEPVSATGGSDYASPGSCSEQAHATEAACTGAGETWTPLSGMLTFGTCTDTTHTTQQTCEGAAGTWNGTSAALDVQVVLLPDYDAEDDETLELRLSYADTAGGMPLSALVDGDDPPAEVVATGTITDNPPPALTVDDVSVGEGGDLEFTVTLERPRTVPDVTVNWAATTHQAVAGRDFEAVDDTLTFTPSDQQPTQTVTVTTFRDTVVEIDETMHLVLNNAAASTGSETFDLAIEGGPGVGTIEDVSPVIVLADTPVVEEGGVLTFTIRITDSNGDAANIEEAVTVHYETEDGTAVGGPGCAADYKTLVRDTLTFTPGGDTVYWVSVETCRDVYVEDVETFLLVLELDAQTRHAAVGDFGVGTIVDASDPPAIRIADAEAQEGDPMSFEVGLWARDGDGDLIPAPSSRPVTVTVVTGDGTATAPGDYTALPAQTLTIPAGRASVPLPVDTVVDDLDDEHPETFYVGISNPVNAKIDKAVGVGTIHPRCFWTQHTEDEEDSPPDIDIIVPDKTISERDHYEVQVRFSRPICTGSSIWVQWDEESGGPHGNMTPKYEGSYDWDTDLRILRTGEWGWPLDSYQIIQPITPYGAYGPFTLAWSQSLRDDSLDEDDEWFTVRARWGPEMPSHYQGLGWVTGRITVTDDDPPPGLTVQDASATEGSAMSFTVSLDARSSKTVTVEYSTADRSGTGAATAGSDYTAAPWTGLTIAPGETSATFTVDTATDTDTDNGETFLVKLRAPESSNPDDPALPMNAQIVDGVAVGTILEGDPPTLSIADASGDEGSDMEFTLTLDGTLTEQATVMISTEEGPAGTTAAVAGPDTVAGSDYLPFIRFLWTIPAGSSDGTWTLSVPVWWDSIKEPDETFQVRLHDPVGVSLADPRAVGTINGDDCYNVRDYSNFRKAPSITADNPTVDEDAGAMAVTLTISEPYCADNKVEVSHHILGTATERADFYRPASEIWFDALETTTTFSLEIIDDELIEPDETIVIGFTTEGIRNPFLPWHVTWSTGEVTGTITDNDEVSLQVADASGDEGDAVAFALTLDKAAGSDVTVEYATADGTATAGADYTAVSGTATIPRGQFSTTVSVDTAQDSDIEGDESFELRLTNPEGALVPAGGEAATGTIRDDDWPGVQISDAAGDEGTALTFTVSIDMVLAQDITVGYATSDGTATAPADYAAASDGSVTIPTGKTSATFTVAALADADAESTERFFVDIASDPFYRIDDGRGVGTIGDVTRRALTVSDAYAVEGGTLGFRVGFEGPPVGSDITVGYRTVAGTAAAGDDYSAASGTLIFAAGETFKTVNVATVQDTLDEDAERLDLVLSDPGDGAVLAVDRASGVIIDDDPEPVVSVGDAEATENDDGAPAAFTVSLSEASGREVSVQYWTQGVTATAGDDYVADASGATVTIPAGDTTAVVDVVLVNDDEAEEVERFLLGLSSPTGARMGDGIGVGTILDDDGAVQILVDDAPEAYEGPDAAAVFEVRLGRAADAEVTVNYSTADATATDGADYTAASGTLTFAVGETSKTVSVDILDDEDTEITETFRLELNEPSDNAELGWGDAVAKAVIVDDDGLPALSVVDTSGAEGDAAAFEVRVSAPSSRDATFGYAAVRDPTAGQVAAVPAQDFDPVSGTVTVPARSLSATVTVPLPEDSVDEHAERFWLRLSNPVHATIADGTATGTVIDNDPLPRLSIGDAAATEGGTVAFTVLLEPVSGRTVTVPWTTGGGTASPTEDYTPASGTLTFPAGATSAQIDVATVDDDTPEDDETFRVSLGPPTNAALGDAVAVGIIHDDDGPPRMTIANAEAVVEGNGPAVFTVTLNRSSKDDPVTVDYDTSDGSAVAGADYATDGGARGTLSIPVGLTTGEISIAVIDDDLTEGVETFNITLSNPSNAVIAQGAATATATIIDDEHPNITIASARAVEGDSTLDFAVTLDRAASDSITVDYATFDGTAVQPDDYTAAAGTLTIAAGDTAATIGVTLTDDTFTEDTETFRIRLSAAAGARIATADAVGTITDDDGLPVISHGSPGHSSADVLETQGTVGVKYFLSRASDVEVSFSYRIRQRSRHHSNDSLKCPWLLGPAARTGGTITFPPGSTEQELTLTLIDNDVECRSGVTQWSEGHKWDLLTIVPFDPMNAVIAPGTEFGLVVHDDEALPDLRLRRGEAVESSDDAALVVTASRPHELDITVSYDMVYYRSSGEATPGVDYTKTSGTLTIPAGETEVDLPIAIIDDDIVEPDEWIEVDIRNAVNANIVTSKAIALFIIRDDDTAPQVSVADVHVAEDAGAAVFTIVLDQVSDEDVTVNYATADGTATEPSDYGATSGTATVPAGDSVATVRVPVVDDSDEEGDETFTLTLSGAAGATISDDAATATIDDDDDSSLPVITVGDAAGWEDASGSIQFPVTLSRESEQTVSVLFRFVPVPSLGPLAAVFGDYPFGDMAANVSGTVTLEPGETSTTLRAGAHRDSVPEYHKKFLVVFSDPVNAVLGNAQAWGTILDDDHPSVTVADAAASESAGVVTFTVTLDAPAVAPGALDYETSVRGSAGSAAATPDDDYTETTGKVSIPVGAQSVKFTVPIIGDSHDEADETFLVTISNPVYLTITDPIAVGTITDDDPGWTIDDRSVWENAGTMDFTVERDHASSEAVTVSYRIAAAGSAVGGTSCSDDRVDYITPSGSVTLKPADTTATISITLCNDTDVEGKETLLIELTGVPGRKLTGVGTITSDD